MLNITAKLNIYGEIIVQFKDRIISKRHILQKHKGSGQKIYNICYSKRYMYNIIVFRQRHVICKSFHDSYSCDCNWTYSTAWKCATESVCGQFLSSPALLNNSHTTKNCCRNVRANINGMMKNFGQKMKLQLSDIKKG